MGASQKNINTFTETFPKVTVMEETLTKAVLNFKDLVMEFEQIHIENSNFRKICNEQRAKLEKETCSSCNDLRKIIANKEELIDIIASALKKLTQTKDFNLIEVILNQLYGETNIQTPPKTVSPHKENLFVEVMQTLENKENNDFKNPLKEMENICSGSNDESVSEIEGTPTGRKSPVLQSRKAKCNLSYKDKKKCSDTWPSSETKAIKLTYPYLTPSKPGKRLRQGRLSVIKVKSTNVIDLTCSPENSGGIFHNENTNTKTNIKKEALDIDETILPSPTSAPLPFLPLGTSPIKRTEINDETHCGNESISLLQHILKKNDTKYPKQCNSPSKRPLAENVNVINIQNHDNEASMSTLPKETGVYKAAKATDEVKRVKAHLGPAYKEPTVRKKAEKRALPGWSCDQCALFYDELYKDNPAMLAQKMDECSKHRGRNNPIRPKTPEGFWNPRWDVPEDTEEFNKRNNAI